MYPERPRPLRQLHLLLKHTFDHTCSRIAEQFRTPDRRRGLSRRLLRAALAEVGDAPCELGAQVYAVPLYTSVGFQPVGDEYIEDGIPHITMRCATVNP